MNEVIVIGGGAAGLMAAVTAAEQGAHVTLLEKNEKLGKKIYITGKGRCNATNLCGEDTFRKNVVKNPRFLFSALNGLSPAELIDWFQAKGCPMVVERGNRAFPESQKASDITRVFERELSRLRVKVRLNTAVEAIESAERGVTGVTLATGERLRADSVIVATGGQSYPSTGSTGDGWRFCKSLGHTVFPALPSLVGLNCGEAWVTELQGLSLKNVTLSLKEGKKVRYSELGEMLFTHFGVSGPLVLSASAYMAEMSAEEASLTLDLKPGLSAEQLDARILREISEAPRKQIGTLLCSLFPARLAETVGSLCELDGTKQCSSMTREERERLIARTKSLTLPVTGLRSLEEAIVTRGGVNVKEINPSTMESRLVKGLFIAGELLDVDALTGGFNLHIAFSTGRLAGESAANS